ncbi:SRPBCC family protein [Blastococcus sp. TF02A-26]|uniref:SRPBCC family protein n=1 Tax=Blastococcus sp. TF02A-26 TaxID=2250577 RepID=UPI000DEA052D|nr:SRPBCC family protein [Blastococcus sp. TF02A-26]RBY80803.1 SRPBCC family protein [Blastococcus sp. TF02A-26]
MIRALAATAGTVALADQLLHATRDWGATRGEATRVLPGDELVPGSVEQTTLAVTVEAPPEAVWPWLVQIGRGRGGMYSYDRLENLIGLDIHSTDEIREEWQHLAPGDRVEVVPAGYGPIPQGYSFPVAQVLPGRALVLRQAPPEHPWNAVWSFHLVPHGPGRSRLLSRSIARRPSGIGLRLANRVMEPVTLVMTRRMLHGIKHRAERRFAEGAPVPVESPTAAP